MSSSRIPADKSASFNTWAIPEVKRGQIVQAEKLRQRGPRGELINVARDEVLYTAITAEQLEEITRSAYDEVREQAHRDGYETGHGEGYQAGLAAGAEAVAQQTAALKATAAQLMVLLGEQDDRVEQALVNMAVCIASSVIRRELALDSGHILEVVREAMQTLPANASNITLYLSEQDYQLLQDRGDIPAQWRVQADPALTPGGCRVTTDQSVVDYTLEEQFQQMVNRLVEARYAALGDDKSDPDRDN